MNRRLHRSVSDRKIGGVAAGTADYFDIDPSISRVLWLLLAIFTGGVFGIVYLVMWAVVPEEPWTPPVPGQAATAAEVSPPADGEEGAATPASDETVVTPAATGATSSASSQPGRSQSRSTGGRGPTSSSA